MKKFITIMVLALAAMLMVSCLGFSATEIEKVEFVEAPQSVYVGDAIPEITAKIKITFVGDTEQIVKATINNSQITLEPTITGIDVKAVITDKAGVDNCHTLTINFGTYVTLTHEFYVVTDINEYYFAGVEEDAEGKEYFKIENAQQLSNIRFALDKNFKLMNNIDISDMQWTPIGNGHRDNYATAEAFKGIFDGNNKIINGLSNKNYAPDIAFVGFNSDNELDFAYGLFGCTDGATIKNLTLTNVNIDFSAYSEGKTGNEVDVFPGSIGAVVGQAFNDLTLIDVNVGTASDNSNIIARDGAAGLVGRLYQRNATAATTGKFENCNNYAHIYIEANDDKKNAGFIGFVTYAENTQPMRLNFESCINYGFIETSVNNTVYQSGFANVQRFGENNADTIIMTNCKNKGEIKGKYHDEKKLVQLMVIEHELGININHLNQNFNKGKVNGFKNGCYIIIENCEIKTGKVGEYPAFAGSIAKK